MVGALGAPPQNPRDCDTDASAMSVAELAEVGKETHVGENLPWVRRKVQPNVPRPDHSTRAKVDSDSCQTRRGVRSPGAALHDPWSE